LIKIFIPEMSWTSIDNKMEEIEVEVEVMERGLEEDSEAVDDEEAVRRESASSLGILEPRYTFKKVSRIKR
jgi:hypothetical protein